MIRRYRKQQGSILEIYDWFFNEDVCLRLWIGIIDLSDNFVEEIVLITEMWINYNCSF